MRNLKYHEKKLLKKVNLDEWKKTNTQREQLVTTKYLLHDRDQYVEYNILVGKIRKLTESLARLDDTNVTKKFITNKMNEKLYALGIIEEKKLVKCIKVTVSDFCKRRLPIVVAHKKLVENFKDADKFVQHGHFKVGTTVTTNPSLLIPRDMEEFVKWADNSKIKKKIDMEADEYDDFEYM